MTQCMSSITYHLAELEVMLDKSHPDHNMPDQRVLRNHPDVLEITEVLDVGCGIGQAAYAEELATCGRYFGIDVDARAIEYGKRLAAERGRARDAQGRSADHNIDLRVGSAELLPFMTDHFDMVMSRVSVPYTNIPVALKEMHRVLGRAGYLWITLHGWKTEVAHLSDAVRHGDGKRFVDRGYVCANSVGAALTGRSFPRPWNGRHESVQAEWRIRRELHRLGFEAITIDRSRGFQVTARKA